MTAGDAVPTTIPARMINEFVYCPRLFYFEWVQSRFAVNDDVEEGQYVHRVVDQATGDLPAPDENIERFDGRAARSLWLTSADLGITAKLDLAETDGDTVVPVDYKKGHPDRHGRLWPADEVQVVTQALLLREAGYRVDRAEVWYAETRQRVALPITPKHVADGHAILTDLRTVAADEQPPPPLDNSPKCPRCSLVGICLPDETNALRTRESQPPRPRALMAADLDNRPVYLSEQGALVGVRRGRLEISKERATLGSYRLIDVSQLCLLGNITITPQAIRELMNRQIAICWFSYGGWFAGILEGLPAKNVDIRRGQYTADQNAMLDIARRMIDGKIRNARTLLRRNARPAAEDSVDTVIDQLKNLAAAAQTTSAPASLLGIEGTAARLYFARFTDMLGSTDLDVSSFHYNGRARRPPPDPVNALLSFAYALLVKDLTVTLTMVGLDPYSGIYHRPRYGRPALALDLAEEFRPIIADSTVIQMINNGELRAKHFLSRAGPCQLTAYGRRAVIATYERRMAHEIKHPVFGYRVNYRRALDVQARILAAHLTGELPTYTPFTTR